MITEKEACALFLTPKEIVATMNGRNYDLLPEKQGYINDVLMAALGDCVVSDIQACEEDCFAIDVLMEPVRKEAEPNERSVRDLLHKEDKTR